MPPGTASTLRALALGMGGLAALAAAVEFAEAVVRQEAVPAAVPNGSAINGPATDAPAATLTRCRTVAPDDEAALEACRAVWEEARRRFFSLPAETALSPAEPAGAE